MSDTVYAIASGKGGVGKTTTAINLGAMLADRGHAVVVVDTDLGMANLADFLDFEIETPTLHEVLAGEAAFDEAVYRAPGDIDVLPSATDIEAFVKSDPANLRAVVDDLRGEYDYVLLDTGAGVSYDTLVPLALADRVLLVATPDVASVRDTAKTGELAERVDSEVRGAVLTQRSSDILNADDVEDTLGTDVLAVVPQDEAVPMGIDAGRPLAAFAPNAPAGQAYRDLAAVLTGAADPDPELDFDEGADGDAASAEDEPATDALSGSEMAANVRDAIDDGDGSGGLLGGELANAADEIRAQAKANATESSADPADAEPGTGSESEDATAAKTASRNADSGTGPADGSGASDERTASPGGNEDEAAASGAGGTEPSGADEARSVDDLINEHISDERLGGPSASDDGDDPLAQLGDELSGDDADADAPADDGGENPAAGDGDAAASVDPFEADDDPLAADEDAVGDEGASPTGASDEPESRDGANDPASDREAPDDVAGAVPFEERNRPGPDDRPAAGSAERAPGESPDGRDASDESGRDDDRTPDDEPGEDGGVLGRLGSIFK